MDITAKTAPAPVQRVFDINIAVINASTKITDLEANNVVQALQIQLDRDFVKVWGVTAKLHFVPHGAKPQPGHWWLSLLDNSDQAGALGYHDLTPEGLPIGKSFVGSDIQYGLAWSVTTSHELLEMLIDPYVNLTVFAQTGDTAGTLYSYEVADACEDDKFAYDINGVKVSDFVTPAWFESWRVTNSTKFDFMGHITAPFQLLPGGYIGKFDVSSGGGWSQETAETVPTLKSRAPVGCRRERRTVAQDKWMISTAHT